MKILPKTVLVVYNDGHVQKFTVDDLVLDKLAEVLSFHENIEKPIPAITESYRESFYRLVYALGYGETVKYTVERAKRLRTRLKTFSLEDLLKAADGIRNNSFMQGENPQGKRYGTIDYLLRNDEIVDNYRQNGSDTKFDMGSLDI